jgi:membrane-associated phospholipid phosphatase
VSELPFSLSWIEALQAHRSPLLTPIFQLFTFLGEIEGYVLLIALVYVAFDKRLAVRLAVITLVAMSLNHFLKTLIANPRPFVTAGTWAQSWAVSPERAADLVTEYSTPSGHAMAGGAFYGYLFAIAKHPAVRAAALALLLLTGLSRPYLGVHYLEDVLLGWAIGLGLAFFAVRRESAIRRAWQRFSHAQQIAIAVGTSAALWLLTRVLAGFEAGGQPTAFVSYMGFLTGIVVGAPIEERAVRFDPTRGKPARKALRYALVVTLVLGTLAALDALFSAVAADATPLGDALRFLRYALASIVAMLVAPWLFERLRL